MENTKKLLQKPQTKEDLLVAINEEALKYPMSHFLGENYSWAEGIIKEYEAKLAALKIIQKLGD